MTPSTPKYTELVASVTTKRVEDTYFRHAAPGRNAFTGALGGRWGAGFPVIYLGSPIDSVVVEAYRHLVEDAGVPAARVRPRVLYTVDISVGRILDLTDASAAMAVGLGADEFTSAVGNYADCQRIAHAAHQLRLHGILAPAASGTGRTLALFRERLTASEIPVPRTEEIWTSLPRDPRGLRLVSRDEDVS